MADRDDLGIRSFGIVNKRLLGQGAFAKVYLVENADKEEFALKVMRWEHEDSTIKAVANKELKVLQTLRHQNVVLYIESFCVQDCMYIITEFCAGGDLGGFLEQMKEEGDTAGLPEDLLLAWLYQMACGLEYMHTPEEDKPVVLHRDLKPGNILLTDTGNLRLGDVGVARMLEHPDAVADTFCGTIMYMSPEVLREQPYNFKADIWSLGCCVGELATLRHYNPAERNLFGNITVKTRERLPEQYSDALNDLVGRMLQKNVDQRITASDILDSSLLQDCCDRMETPQDLLQRHNLLKFLANRRDLSPAEPTEEPIANPGNLGEILKEDGNAMQAYRDKQKHRLHGRREDPTVKQHPGTLKKTNPEEDNQTPAVAIRTPLWVSEKNAKTSSPDAVDSPFFRADQAATVIEGTAVKASTDAPVMTPPYQTVLKAAAASKDDEPFMTSDQATVIVDRGAKERKPDALNSTEGDPPPRTEEKEGRRMSSTRSKKKQRTRTQRYTSNVFAMFNQGQIQEFKEAFNMIDQNRDGYVDKDDLFEMYTSLGKNPTEEELDVMINMAPGPINFTMFLTLFGEKLNGTDPEDVIKNAFACFDEKNAGFINEDYLRECLMTMGDRWSDDMVDELFHGAPIKEGRFDYQEFTRTLKHGAKEKDEEGEGEGQQGQGQSQGQGQEQAPAAPATEAAAE